MIFRTSTLCFLIILACLVSRASHAGSTILVLYGSKKKTETESWLKKYSADKSVSVSFPPGYPKVLHSDKVKGLNPGFWIVAAGSCPDDSASALAVTASNLSTFQKSSPGTYAKTVAEDAKATDCPLLEAGISLTTTSLEKTLMTRAFEYDSQAELEKAEYLADYILMMNPKNQEAIDLSQKMSLLKTN